jgi:D-alanyl-D-alanine dipeptidase
MICQNRRILYRAITSADFSTAPDEWWHFRYGNQKWAVSLQKEIALYGDFINNN